MTEFFAHMLEGAGLVAGGMIVWKVFGHMVDNIMTWVTSMVKK